MCKILILMPVTLLVEVKQQLDALVPGLVSIADQT